MKYYIVNRLEKLVLMKVPEELDTRFQQEYGPTVVVSGVSLPGVLQQANTQLTAAELSLLEPLAERFIPAL